jgi:hypothetical protein
LNFVRLDSPSFDRLRMSVPNGLTLRAAFKLKAVTQLDQQLFVIAQVETVAGRGRALPSSDRTALASSAMMQIG